MAVNVNFATANCNWVPRQESQAPSPTDFASLVWGMVEEGGGAEGEEEGRKGKWIDSQ